MIELRELQDVHLHQVGETLAMHHVDQLEGQMVVVRSGKQSLVHDADADRRAQVGVALAVAKL
ncbi:MAG TPA: hypothetical protein VJ809_12430, partial [Pirellulales bacterium]|nr:hypothetical protein [Pirellulales bacterium]